MTSASLARAVLITGAAGGIGLSLLEACMLKGWHVFAACTNEKKLRAQLSQLNICATAQQLTCLQYDVTDPTEVKKAFRCIQQSDYQLYGLVNNAGIMKEAALGMTSIDDFEIQMQVNVTACFTHLQLASRLMTKHKTGSIVNISSVIGLDGAAGQVAYATSKSALLGMTKSAAKELAKLNIRVNAVAPGFIYTKLTEHYEGEKREQVIANIAINRAGLPCDVAALVVHLLDESSAYTTGQTIRVDGMMSV